jgi:hypothetical protein
LQRPAAPRRPNRRAPEIASRSQFWLKVKHIDSAQKIIRVEQSKGRKDRNVMLSPDTLDLLRGGRRAGAVSIPQRR